ncbi:MAG: peptidoglycan bridge formation glycyltransferase FemA/FemB family protein [Candidatus Pacearchaeota archaeon]
MFKDIQATIEIDLLKSEEELFDAIDKDAKWGIKKAEKEEIIVQKTKEIEDLQKFYNIYKKTMIYGGIVPEKIENLKKENSILFVAKKDNKIIAGAIIIVVNKEKFKLEYNASLYSFLKFQPNNLLYWSLIQWGKRNGFKIFDLGGYQLKAHGHLKGVNRFKERWGGQIKTYYVKSGNPVYILGRKVIRNIPFIKNIRDSLKLQIYLSKEKYKQNQIKKRDLFKIFFKKFIYNNSTVFLYSSFLENNKILEPKIKGVFKPADIKEMMKFVDKDSNISQETIEERFDEGHQCFIYLFNNKLAHYSWVSFEEMNILEVNAKIPLQSGEAVIYDCYTNKEFRNKGIYSAMLTKIKDYLMQKNFVKSYIYVESNNKASINGIEKAGFTKEKILKYRGIIGFKNNKIEVIK